MTPRPPRTPLFPYTTLFRSDRQLGDRVAVAVAYVRKDGRDFIGWTDIGGRYSQQPRVLPDGRSDRKSTRLNSSHSQISYAVFCLKKKTTSNADSARVSGSRS